MDKITEEQYYSLRYLLLLYLKRKDVETVLESILEIMDKEVSLDLKTNSDCKQM